MIKAFSEGNPANYPTVTGLSTRAAALNLPALWKRIEHHIAYRYSERQVTYLVEGPGEFIPHLKPFVLDNAERCDGGE